MGIKYPAAAYVGSHLDFLLWEQIFDFFVYFVMSFNRKINTFARRYALHNLVILCQPVHKLIFTKTIFSPDVAVFRLGVHIHIPCRTGEINLQQDLSSRVRVGSDTVRHGTGSVEPEKRLVTMATEDVAKTQTSMK